MTAPLGYNDFLDQFVLEDKLPFKESYVLVRTSADQDWRSVTAQEALQAKYRYSSQFPAANALFIGLGVK